MTSSVRIHAVLACLWIPLALVLAMKVALLGSEEVALKKARGADLKSRTDMAYRLDRLKGQLDYEASVPAIESAVRTLQLPLSPPKLAEAPAVEPVDKGPMPR
jgi:hypothetical protein